ncbi:MAG: nitrite reductase [Rhodospirillales bacterium]|nr:nitrite reductase [Rhodospirillales bacterium]
MKLVKSLFVAAIIFPLASQAAEMDAGKLYEEHCLSCHGVGRLGGQGPALIPSVMKRLRKNSAIKVINEGRPATQMEGFADRLNKEQVDALIAYIYKPLAQVPTWSMAQIKDTHDVMVDPSTLPTTPQHKADPMNLFTVVEGGDHHVTILDGDKFEPLWRFATRFTLHGGAKYSPDGRFVYLATRDGWVSMHDLHNFETIAEVRVGINTRNIAVSADGKYVMAGNYLPHSLVVLNANDLTPVKYIPVADRKGNTSRVSAVYAAPPRDSFIVALKDIKEIWELSWDPNAEPVYGNFVHNYRKDQLEAIVEYEQPFGIRRIEVPDYMEDFFFDASYSEVIGAARNSKKGMVFNLDARRKAGDLELESMPHLGSGIYWKRGEQTLMATPHIKGGVVSVIDMDTWKTVKKIKTKGPGFFMRSHKNSPYAWVDVFFGPHKDLLHVIDKKTLEIVKTINPAPGKTNAHVEFTKNGSHVLVSVWEHDGALVVYDAKTFEEVKRIPMKKPVGKYNVYNKITYEEGTSH